MPFKRTLDGGSEIKDTTAGKRRGGSDARSKPTRDVAFPVIRTGDGGRRGAGHYVGSG